MARIAWYSNSCHIPSGYGAQSAQVLHRLTKDGHQTALVSNHGASVMMNCAHGHPIFPEGLLRYSVDSAPDTMRDWIGDQPGFGVVLFDLWPLAGVEAFKRLNLACWTPIDHKPVPGLVAKFLQDGEHVAIAMSRLGKRNCAAQGYQRIGSHTFLTRSTARPSRTSARRNAAKWEYQKTPTSSSRSRLIADAFLSEKPSGKWLTQWPSL